MNQSARTISPARYPVSYNFTDDPEPSLTTIITATGAIDLADGDPQGNILTDEFCGRAVSISIEPPTGWILDSVTWTDGGTGTYLVPPVGSETTHGFDYKVSQNGSILTGGGSFKIKRQGGGGGTGN